MGNGILKIPKKSADFREFGGIWDNGLREGNSTTRGGCAMALDATAMALGDSASAPSAGDPYRLRLSVHGHIPVHPVCYPPY